MKKFLTFFLLLLFLSVPFCFSQNRVNYDISVYRDSIVSIQNRISSESNSTSISQKQKLMKKLARYYIAGGNFDKGYTIIQNLVHMDDSLHIMWDASAQPRILNYSFFRALERKKGSYLIGDKKNHPEILVLGVFNRGSSDFTTLGNAFSYFLNEGYDSIGYKTVSRERVRWVLNEFTHGTEQIGLEKAHHLGRIVGVNKVIVGSYHKTRGEQIKVEIRGVNVKSANLFLKKDFSGTLSDLLTLFRTVIGNVVDGEYHIEKKQLGYVLKYSKALEFIIEDHYLKARDLLSSIDEFPKAAERMEGIEPIIANYYR